MGTRPEAIKLAPVIHELKRFPQRFEVRVIASGQHRRLADQVLAAFGIEPDYDLNVMTSRQSLTRVTARVLTRLEPVLAQARPHLVLVQGDAATAFVGALAAYYHKSAVGHVEAGLRTGDKYNPFPEEVFRRLVTPMADLHFAPTETARATLLAEGVHRRSIYVTGNTVIDALLSVAARDHPLPTKVARVLGCGGAGVSPAKNPRSRDGCAANDRRLLLVTAHRRENWGPPLRHICRALRALVRRFEDVVAVYALHPNPQVTQLARAELAGEKRVVLIQAPPYFQFVSLMRRAHLVLTDSGGLQEEAPALGKPVLVLRRTTERPEGVAAGVARLVGTDARQIVAAAATLLCDERAYQRMARAVNPYGDGTAAPRIRQAILHHFGLGPRPQDFTPR